jgi:hypothetical protein
MANYPLNLPAFARRISEVHPGGPNEKTEKEIED